MEKPDFASVTVKWTPPKSDVFENWFRWIFKRQPGPSGGGGIIREEGAKTIAAYAIPSGNETKTMAEALALKTGIDWCMEKGIQKLEVESDPKLLIDWILDKVHGTYGIQWCTLEASWI